MEPHQDQGQDERATGRGPGGKDDRPFRRQSGGLGNQEKQGGGKGQSHTKSLRDQG